MKACCVCKREFLLQEFPVRSASLDGHTNKCFECTREYNRKDYVKHRSMRSSKNNNNRAQRRIRNREFVLDYLQKHNCVDCDESDYIVLTFDHTRGEKTGNISDMVGYPVSLEALEKEISKCVVRCANCHTRRTATQFNWYSNVGS
jgi:hypothetical protein